MAESVVGGYDYVFITDLSEDFVCTLCHLAFKNPLQIEECGHTFCKLCFDQMVDHAESNSLDITCPLDRQKIDVSRVFKDKSCERKVLNLMVKCPNFVDDCDWTGELREALLNRPMDEKLIQLLNRMIELETNAKSHGLKLVEKDKQMENLIAQMENENKKAEDLNKQMENLIAQIENLIAQMENQNKKVEDQSKQIDSLVKQVNATHPCKNSIMIIKNIEDETDFSPICSIFQWKFKPSEIRCGIEKFSPPFYNVMNAHCFQLRVHYVDNNFCIALFRYRGKYDHFNDEIKVTKDFAFEIKVFGKNGKVKTLEIGSHMDYSIAQSKERSHGWWNEINNGEIGSLTIDDGYVNLHCFFNKTT